MIFIISWVFPILFMFRAAFTTCQRDKARLIFRQAHACAILDDGQRLLPHLVLPSVEAAYLFQKGIFQLNPFPGNAEGQIECGHTASNRSSPGAPRPGPALPCPQPHWPPGYREAAFETKSLPAAGAGSDPPMRTFSPREHGQWNLPAFS